MTVGKFSLIVDALQACGENVPASADDGSPEWNTCSSAYGKGLNRLLVDHNWKFAKVIETVEDRTDPDDPNWEDGYTRPGNLTHIIKVMDTDGNAITEYAIVGDQIYVNEDSGILVEGVEDKSPDEWHGFFVDVMMHFLYAGIYRGLKKSPQEARAEENAAEKLLMRARARTDGEEPVSARHVSGLKAARSVRRG